MKLVLKPNRERRLENFHPWVFRDDVQTVQGDAPPGEVGEVVAANGALVGLAYINAKASIPARMLTHKREMVNLEFYRRRIRAALEKRSSITGTNAVRVINAESEGLPGLVADRFGRFLSVQFRNAGVDRHRELITEALRLETGCTSALERSDTGERGKEGLEPRVQTLWGDVPERVDFFEDDVQLQFLTSEGQKTGFFLDQRDNRRRLARLVDASSRVLDVYSYTGGFSLHAARRGAKSFAVDKDAVALATLERVAQQNGLETRVASRLGDALEVLDQLIREKRSFTHAVIDPPTLAKRKDEVTAAKRIFTIATKNVLRMLEPGGIVFVSTCAYHIKLEDLLEATRFAGADAKRRLEVLDVTFQPADHPWVLQIPETLYLKTLILRAD